LHGYSEFEPGLQPLAIERQAGALRLPRDEWARTKDNSLAWKALVGVERGAALALVVLLLPVLLAVGSVIWLLSRRTPLIAHARVGLAGETIWVLKLRTMWGKSCQSESGKGRFIERLNTEPVPEIKSRADERITSKFAAFCRKYSIDELPQLWHVVEGRMSLVGPRPMTRDELAEHYGELAGEVIRVRPGLTGLWQTRGRSALTYRQRRRLDLFLVRNLSLRLYLAILLATVPKVLTGKNAW
jgi:exopolysaccharide production protein ExoY